MESKILGFLRMEILDLQRAGNLSSLDFSQTQLLHR